MIEGKRILITGGAGFIGSLTIGRLVERNEITVLDNLVRNSLSSRPFADHPNLRLEVGDVLDQDFLRRHVPGHDVVVHCAAIAGIDSVVRSPVTTLKVNMIGSANVLEAVHESEAAVERVVCFSTSEVFGPRALHVSETDPSIVGATGEPRWTYAAGKLAEEHLAIAYFTEFGMPTTVLRPFNVYGPGQVGEGAIKNFIDQALRNEDLRVRGAGNQIRSWCYVDDMVDAVELALWHPAAAGQVFNIGNERAVATTKGLAETIVRLAESSASIVHTPDTGADVLVRIPDISKATELLGFMPKTDLDEGIRSTIDWCRSQPTGPA
jgi:UDP-glucose 4-epimerase